MLMANDSSSDVLDGFDDMDNYSIDLDSIMQILSEDSDHWDNSSLNGPEALLPNNSYQGGVDPNIVTSWSQSELQKDIIDAADVPQREYGLPESSEWHRSETIVPAESLAGMGPNQMFEFPETSGIIFDHAKVDSGLHINHPRTCSVSFADWSKMSCVEYDTCSSREGGGTVVKAPLNNYDRNMMPSYAPSCSTAFNFASGDSTGNLIDKKSEQAIDFWHGASNLTASEGSGLNFGDQSAICGASMDNPALEIKFHISPAEIGFIDVEASSPDPHRPDINVDPVVDMHCGAGKIYSEQSSCERSGTIADNSTCTDSNDNVWFDLSLMESKEQNMIYTDGEVEDKFILSQHTGTSNKMKLEAEEAASRMDFSNISICQSADPKFEVSSHCSPTGVESSGDADGSSSSDSSRKSLPAYQSFMPGKKEMVCIEDDLRAERHTSNHSSYCEAGEGYCSSVRSSDYGVEDLLCTDQGSNQFALNRDSQISTKRSKVSVKDERNNDFTLSRKMDFQYAKVNGVVKHNNSVSKSSIDEDADLCILEEISHPRYVPTPRVHEESFITKQRPVCDSLYHIGMEGTRLKAIDERITLHVALQDLSQPKSEVAPPDGALAVPLLRHQRIALSWMVQKETGSIHCSGGILADDQGLGKTISTIALILTERSPSSKVSSIAVKQKVLKAFNLDDDEDCEVLRLNGMKQATDSGQDTPNKSPEKKDNSFLPAKGRPAAGTLVVCPTSVLRQWAEELQSKVSEEFKLSTLVYHGSNRTKEPLELAKYDVVLTTYSIVSMEVPKQPLVDKDDDEKVEAEGIHSMEFSSSKKRKYSPSVDKKSQKNKKGMNGSLLEAIARPLARVGWFRVVLDEAQSIKNHRTQVARACWGLRAKRRWCLSGTPIQNAIDDLYSYFRFLRYDPYASYKSFCSLIKNPISRNPTNGYKKLQAVLKTIMLRRTKGTLLDGEPIINLPPKSVKLKRVDFSLEERDFYSKLEADSRAQFKVYAAAGTVKQNYVNILLMLLRLRQACDHPLLVKGYDSSSVWRSSIETAKKLDGEKQTKLLDCLEACSEVCSICNDPPEDAVVTICGHIFCNQCILEYLTGDENLCPAVQCKVHLNITYVFSRDTLRSSLFDQPENIGPASQSIDSLEPCSQGLSDSSKIKAALEVLESLSKPQNFLPKDSSLKSKNEVTVCSENSTESCLQDNRQSTKENCSNDSTVKLPEKAIVFSQWTRMLDLLEAQLKNSSIQYRRLDGTMSVLARDKAVKDFNTLPEVTVMIMSLKAASLGLNMVAACHVILLDLWWNPTTEDQAIDRAHRIGQTRPVTVLRLTVKDTVEDRILALQQKKRVMVSSAFGEDETGSRQTRLTVDDLKYLFMA